MGIETLNQEPEFELPDEGEALGSEIEPAAKIAISAAQLMYNRPRSGSTDKSMPPGVGLAL